ncbi:MAG: sigma-54-dependent transcriptional regulator [Syntrophobacteraceae bacterium]
MAKAQTPVILIADDDQSHRLMLTTLMQDWGFRTQEALDGGQALEIIRANPVDLILMDMRMPNMDGIEATRSIAQHNPAIPIIIVTAYSSIPTAVEAMKSGAFDYVTKPIDFEALRLVMDRALEHTRLLDENERLRRQLAGFQAAEMTGQSPAMRKLLEMVALVAPAEATVLITGESGTGKGLVARTIHANSSRKEKPLVEVNCAAIPENLIESELFGHEKGAFTGADKQRKGRFSMAHGGTLFLDEIGELPLPMQAKLLRVIQEGEIQRVGSDSSIPVDVRLVAATNRKIEKMVSDGAFREDLYYRLNVFALHVPPLRERVEDIPALAQTFLMRFSKKNRKAIRGVTPQAMDLLLRYAWPGNVRELENAMERAVILLQGEYLSPAELPMPLQTLAQKDEADDPCLSLPDDREKNVSLADIEKETILQKLREAGGNKSEAARRLGITRRTLKLKLKRYLGEEDSGADDDEG